MFENTRTNSRERSNHKSAMSPTNGRKSNQESFEEASVEADYFEMTKHQSKDLTDRLVAFQHLFKSERDKELFIQSRVQQMVSRVSDCPECDETILIVLELLAMF